MGLFDKVRDTVNKVVPKPFQKPIDPLNILGSDYQKNAGARAAEKEAQIASSLSEGRQRGLDLARLGYNQGFEETGSDIQRIKGLQRARTEQSDPISETIRSQKSGAIASGQRNLAAAGVKGGAAAGALEEIGRKQDADIAASLYGQQRQSLADERSLASNMLSGTTSLMFGSSGEAAAQNMPQAPSGGGMLGTVICTELYRQGYMDLATYSKDSQYGLKVLKETPEVIVGYQFLATPIVKLMKKSQMFTKIISYPALKWARHIANEENSIVGVLAVNIGQPICGIIGKVLTNVFGVKYV